jgi:hypothetical protein
MRPCKSWKTVKMTLDPGNGCGQICSREAALACHTTLQVTLKSL